MEWSIRFYIISCVKTCMKNNLFNNKGLLALHKKKMNWVKFERWKYFTSLKSYFPQIRGGKCLVAPRDPRRFWICTMASESSTRRTGTTGANAPDFSKNTQPCLNWNWIFFCFKPRTLRMAQEKWSRVVAPLARSNTSVLSLISTSPWLFSATATAFRYSKKQRGWALNS